MLKKSILLLQFILLFSLSYSQCPDGTEVCLTLDGGNLDYESTADIGGFQFSHNGCVENASGGDAAANGFTISASNTVILAFSFTGSVVPAGSGTLVVLDGDVTEDCLSNFIFSDASGNGLNVAVAGTSDGEEDVFGCMDDTACNYDESANSDDGTCEYPLENYMNNTERL